jgi:hypothetical protein
MGYELTQTQNNLTAARLLMEGHLPLIQAQFGALTGLTTENRSRLLEPSQADWPWGRSLSHYRPADLDSNITEMHRTRRLCKVERDHDQVVYVIRTECSKEFGGQNQARVCLIGTPKPIPQSRQDHDENQNRCCTLAPTRARSGGIHLDDVATGPNGTRRSSSQAARPLRHLRNGRRLLRSGP